VSMLASRVRAQERAPASRGPDYARARRIEDRLVFTPHALVRYIERYVDARGVRACRRLGFADSEILAALRPFFAAELARFVAQFEHVYDNRSSQFRNVTCGISYRLRLGRIRIVVCCGVCITTLPLERHAVKSNERL